MSQALAQADDLLRRGERQLAAQKYLEILATEPGSFLALHRLGIIEFQSGRRQEALRRIGEALAIQPDDPQILSDFGLVQTALNDAAGALASYDKAIELDNGLADTHCRRADLLRMLGRPDEALASYERAIALNPAFAQALNNQGLALAALGRPLEALASYDRALAAKPDHLLALCNRGRTLHELGRFEAALESYDRALALNPAYLEVLNNRGVALQGLGRLEAALASFDRALELKPDYFEALNNRANVLKDLGRLEEALAGLDQALAADPRSAIVLNNRGNVLRELDRLDEALTAYDLALALQPDFVEALAARGFALWRTGRPLEALASYDRALSLNPGRAGDHNVRALVLLSLDRPDEALATYDLALAIDPKLADAWGNKAMLLIELGRLEEASCAAERAIELSPQSVRAYYILTLAKRMAAGDPHLKAMLALARGPGQLKPDDEIHLRFALAKALDDAGEPGQSTDQLFAAAKLKRSHIRYDEAETLAVLERTAASFGAERLRMAEGQGEPSDAPVFIVGMPRSGSTLTEQILASHPKVHATGETDHWARALGMLELESGQGLSGPEALLQLAPDQFRRLGELYLGQVGAARDPSERMVNKTLENFRFLGAIHLALPGARIIHTRRDPLDTCLSCFTKLFGDSLAYTYDLGELGRYYRAYERLMAHWRAVLPRGVMLEVRYEDVIADFEGQARSILAHCALDWDPGCLDFHESGRWVHTASAAQVRRPIYASSVGRWRAYEPHLKPLLDALAA
jgi:tetratricopeptide (TPR) repeat protein